MTVIDVAEVKVSKKYSQSKSSTSKPKKEKSNRKTKSKSVELLNPIVPVIPADALQEWNFKLNMKEKSSKKRNYREISNHITPDSLSMDDSPASAEEKRSPTVKSNEEADEIPASRLPKKRKLDVGEIEIDLTAPEPSSKKDLRRLKKGKSLPAPKSGIEQNFEPEVKKTKKTEVEARSEHGIWIGNLPFHVSNTDLRKFLIENSDITENMITRVHIPGPDDKKPVNKVVEKEFRRAIHNKGYAYVDFSAAEGVTMAINLSEQLLGGRCVLIKDNKSFEGRPPKTKETRKDGKPPSRKIFLGNLSFDTTEDSLKEHFEKCGAINDVKVATFEDSGKCKGYAWIVFEEVEAAESAVRGFVRIEEPISDTKSKFENKEVSSEEGVSKPNLTKTKVRKWWVNKIKGRMLRMEYAEDAQVRYKKRYGKDGDKSIGENQQAPRSDDKQQARILAKKVDYRQSYAPRLTGGIVESKGKKITF